MRHLFLLLVVAGMLFFLGLGRLPLIEPDEGRNAEVAREMLAGGDWITPHYNSLAYLDKPAVFFWMVAGSFRLLGTSELAARLPSAVAALGTMLLVWLLARQMFGEAAGWRAAVIWATMPLVIILSRQVIFDMTLTFLITLSMLAFWVDSTSNFERPWLEILMFAAWGVAIIFKGPVGLLLPLLSILAYQALAGRIRELKRLRWGRGIVVFLALSLPWFLGVSIRNPDFPRYAFWQESLLRFATAGAKRGGSIFYYIPVFFAGLLPWSLFIFFAGWNHLAKWKRLRDESSRSTLFLLCWAGVTFLFFTISRSKLPAYFLPATVPFAIFMAQAWSEVEEASLRRPDWLKAGFASLVGIGLLMTLALWWLSQFTHMRERLADKVDPLTLALAKPSLVYTGLILAAIGVLGRDLTQRIHARWPRVAGRATFALLALTTPALFLRWYPALRAYANASSSRRIAQSILASPQKDTPVMGFYYFRTSLPFYLRRPVGLLTADGGQMTSNYQALRFSQYYAARHARGSPTPQPPPQSGEVTTPPSSSPQTGRDNALPNSPPQSGRGLRGGDFSGLLIDPADFNQEISRSRQGVMVLARNDQVQLLMDTAPAESFITGLWTEWRDSVWLVRSAPSANPR